MTDEIERVARKVCSKSLGIRPKEKILIVSNQYGDLPLISENIYRAAESFGASPTLLYQPEKTHFDFMEDAVRQALLSDPDVIVSLPKFKLGKDKIGSKFKYKRGKRDYSHYLRVLLGEKMARAVWSTNMTKERFIGPVDADFDEIKRDSRKVGSYFMSADAIHISSKNGTDFTAKISKRPHYCIGNIKKPGSSGNLPPGEVFLTPVLNSSSGTLVIDGVVSTSDESMIPKEPVILHVTAGSISNIEGGTEAEKLSDALKKAEKKSIEMGKNPKNNKKISEIAVGLNKKARIVPNITEAEKYRGSFHFALGYDWDGQIDSLIHLDQVIRYPTIVLKSLGTEVFTLIREGELKI